MKKCNDSTTSCLAHFPSLRRSALADFLLRQGLDEYGSCPYLFHIGHTTMTGNDLCSLGIREVNEAMNHATRVVEKIASLPDVFFHFVIRPEEHLEPAL